MAILKRIWIVISIIIIGMAVYECTFGWVTEDPKIIKDFSDKDCIALLSLPKEDALAQLRQTELICYEIARYQSVYEEMPVHTLESYQADLLQINLFRTSLVMGGALAMSLAIYLLLMLFGWIIFGFKSKNL